MKRIPSIHLPETLPAAPLKQIQIDGGFWGSLMDRNRAITLPIQYKQCKDTGRLESLKLTWKPGDANEPHHFWDSDIGKWIEAAAYSLANTADPALEKILDEVIDDFARVQRPDGYLNTYFITCNLQKRWTNLRDMHELYCAGHLIEGAVAYYEATGKRKFLDVMCRYADHIGRVFGRGKGQKRGFPGHEEIELALMKLHRVTNEPRYFELAKYFVDERGQTPHYFDVEARARGENPRDFNQKNYEYNQAHLPVRDQSEVVGHSVRAVYLYCGMADVAVATGDKKLFRACRRLWENVVQKRMHITGGLGPLYSNEGFTCDYDLPNEGAYLETCAAIGLVFWAQRMLSAGLDSEYSDVMERALYNGTISGISADARHFFYGNPLAVHPGFDGNGHFIKKSFHYRRSEWFGCACCPPNIARMIAQFPSYIYSTGTHEIAVHQYAQSRAELPVARQTIRLDQQTNYPWDGKITFTVQPEKTAAWTLALRIPGWCCGAKLRVNGKSTPLPAITKKGYARVKRTWKSGDRVELILPMPVEKIEAHPAVRQDCGCVALQRGPVVYCLEETDNGKNLQDLQLGSTTKFKIRPGRSGILKGIPVIHATASRRNPADWQGPLYQRQSLPSKSCQITAIPYYLWANRTPGEMLVWIRK